MKASFEMNTALEEYVVTIKQNLAAGNATEHSHRPALKKLIEDMREDIEATNEPKRHIECGAPDFAILRTKGHLPIGHIEAKDIGIVLSDAERTDQLRRYRKFLPNLLLTDYINFRWYVNGEKWGDARLAVADSHGQITVNSSGQQATLELISNFLDQTPAPLRTAKDLAQRLARLTHMMRDIVIHACKKGHASNTLRDLRQVLAEQLLPPLIEDSNIDEFADLYAQTLTYGLFAARVHHAEHRQDMQFTLTNAAVDIPKTNPLLRQLFSTITSLEFSDEPYARFVHEVVAVLSNTDIEAVLSKFGNAKARQDPTLHFYETFLATYDPSVRERRGVYYTPEPVVGYIVRSVDELLKSHFAVTDGLADTKTLPYTRPPEQHHPDLAAPEAHRTLVLDPAAGTGTFLYEVVDIIRQRFRNTNQAGLWNEYVHEHLLPRIFGFELLMAPYAMAHLKLGMQLAAYDMPELERGFYRYGFEEDDRLQIYLTNTLEQVERDTQRTLGGLQRAINTESLQANRVKRDLPILVVLGNPPYSGISSNNGPWIDGLLKGAIPSKDSKSGKTSHTSTHSYYHIDGKRIKERNPKWLQDDYVKFIRWAQWRLEQTGSGILAFITNHGYIDNPTFRGMRWSLLQSFDEIYILDLHGNSKKREVCPDGSLDENVFDIQQGVAIGIFVKRGTRSKKRKAKDGEASVYHAEIWGKRQDKYEQLSESSISRTPWKKITPDREYFLFKRLDESVLGDYLTWHKITEVFPINTTGIVTGRDNFVLGYTKQDLQDRFEQIHAKTTTPEEIRSAYLKKKDKLDPAKAQDAISELDCVGDYAKPIAYRPFDNRWIFYFEPIIERSRRKVMDHLQNGNNLAMITARSNKFPDPDHFFVSRLLVEAKCGEASTQSAAFPLYLLSSDKAGSGLFGSWRPDRMGRIPNLSKPFVSLLEESTGKRFQPDGKPVSEDEFSPEDVFAYIYAVFYWPTYRARFDAILKLDYPRVPPPSDGHTFSAMVRAGRQLLTLHLLEDESVSGNSISYPITGDNIVENRYPHFVAPGNESIKIGKVRLRPNTDKGRVYINATQFFEGINEKAWKFHIGGYQVCEKWLKDRTGRTLSYSDMINYMKICETISYTLGIMHEIDLTMCQASSGTAGKNRAE